MSTISGISALANNSLPTSTAANPVLQTSIPGLAQSAVSLSVQEGIVATLGGNSASPVTYDAAGLLNALIQAGTPNQSAPTTSNVTSPQAAAQNQVNQDIANALPSSPAASGIYNASGTIQGLPSNTSANWASILQANPDLSSTVIADSVNQGIVGTLSTMA
ncbi:MAG: hypothetical protein WB444_05585 [Gallionella sp.]